MSTTVKYTNLLGKDLTMQQATNMKEYVENIFVGSFLKKKVIRNYIKNQDKLRKKVEYYLDSNENLQTVLNNIMVESNPDRILIFTKENEQYGFTKWRWKIYNNLSQEIGFGGLNVLDNKNREIFFCSYSASNTYQTVIKRLYENVVENHSDDLLLTVKYDLIDNDIKINDVNHKLGYGDFKSFDPDFMMVLNPSLWSLHPYYHSHLPILPDSLII